MLPAYESMLWPLGQMLPFANMGNIIRNILGWKENVSKSRLLVMAGSNDRLMDVPMMQKLSALYRGALQKGFPRTEDISVETRKQYMGSTGVEFVVIQDSGHHLQNDLHWEEAASQLSNFLNQL